MDNRDSMEGPTVPMAPTPDKASVFEDFIDIFYAPANVFARREKSGYGMQLLIISVVAALFAYATRAITAQIFDVEFQRAAAKAIAANPQLTMDQMNSMRGIQEKVATIGGYIATPIIVWVLALLTWLAAKAVSAKITYQQAALIVTLAWIPRLVGMLVMTVQGLLMDTSTITNMFAVMLSPARFMNADTVNPKVLALTGNLEVFGIWYAVLVGIGIAVIGKVPRSQGYTAAAIVFVLTSLPALLR
jgi:hypothetical protein